MEFKHNPATPTNNPLSDLSSQTISTNTTKSPTTATQIQEEKKETSPLKETPSSIANFPPPSTAAKPANNVPSEKNEKNKRSSVAQNNEKSVNGTKISFMDPLPSQHHHHQLQQNSNNSTSGGSIPHHVPIASQIDKTNQLLFLEKMMHASRIHGPQPSETHKNLHTVPLSNYHILPTMLNPVEAMNPSTAARNNIKMKESHSNPLLFLNSEHYGSISTSSNTNPNPPSHPSSAYGHPPVLASVPTDVNRFPTIPASEEPLKRRLRMKKKVNYDDDAYFNTKYIYSKDKNAKLDSVGIPDMNGMHGNGSSRFFVPKAIMDEKVEHGKTLYLVKWQNDAKDTWESKRTISKTPVFQEYHKNRHQGLHISSKEVVKATKKKERRGRPRKNSPRANQSKSGPPKAKRGRPRKNSKKETKNGRKKNNTGQYKRKASEMSHMQPEPVPKKKKCTKNDLLASHPNLLMNRRLNHAVGHINSMGLPGGHHPYTPTELIKPKSNYHGLEWFRGSWICRIGGLEIATGKNEDEVAHIARETVAGITAEDVTVDISIGHRVDESELPPRPRKVYHFVMQIYQKTRINKYAEAASILHEKGIHWDILHRRDTEQFAKELGIQPWHLRHIVREAERQHQHELLNLADMESR